MLSELIVKIGADIKEFDSKMKEVANNLKANSEKMKEIGMNMSGYVTLPILGAGAASIKFASDTEESLNKVNVAFGQSASSIIQWSQTAIDKMGLAQGSALDSAALFGDMATSMGITQDKAASMAMTLTQLGADLASFKNMSIDQAMNALNGVFTGETESLKMLGVVMTQTQLEAFALSQGIQKNIKDMSEAEMVALRFAFVLDRTKNAQGDFARTSGGTANQLRTFQETLKELAASFGREMLPTVNMLLKSMNELLKEFTKIDPAAKKLIVIGALVAAAIGPLLVGIGSIGMAIGGLAAGVAALGGLAAAATLASGAIGILILTGVAIYQWSKTLEYLRYEGDRFRIAYELMGARVKQVFDAIVNEVVYTFNNFKTITTAMIDIASGGFMDLQNAINNLNSELGKNKSIKEYNDLLISQNGYAAEASYNTKMLAHDIDVLGQKFMDNASKQQYMTSWDIIRNNVMQQSLDKNAELIESSKKLAKQRADEVRTSTLEALNKVGSAIQTALKTQNDMREKAEIDSANKRMKSEIELNNQWLASNKKILDKFVNDYQTTSKKIVETKKQELKDIQNAIDAQSNAFIDAKQKEIDDIRKQTELEDQIKADSEKQQELNNKKAIIDNADMNKQIAINNRKAILDSALLENEANRKSEKSTADSEYNKVLIDRKAKEELEKQRMTHDFNQRLQSAKSQDEAAKVVADFEYKKSQNAIDSANELLKIQEEYQSKLASIDAKFNEKNTSLNSEYNNDIVKIGDDLTKEQIKAQEEFDKLDAEQKRTLLLRERDAKIQQAQQAIDAARTTTQIVKDDMKAKKEMEIQQTIDDYNAGETKLKNEYDQKVQWAEKDNERIRNEYETKKTIISEGYTKLNSEEALQAKARELLVKGQQDSLIALLKSYFPEWQNAGQSFGEKILDGLNSKKKSIENAVNEIMNMIKPATNATPPKPNMSGGIGATGVFSTPNSVKSVAQNSNTTITMMLDGRVLSESSFKNGVNTIYTSVGNA